MIHITQEELKSRVSYNPETGKIKWLTARKNRQELEEKRNNIIVLDGMNYNLCTVVWFYETGCWVSPDMIVKQYDNNLFNLKWDNLYLKKTNPVKKTSESKTKIRGLHYQSIGNRYKVEFSVNGERKYFGSTQCYTKALKILKKAKELNSHLIDW